MDYDIGYERMYFRRRRSRLKIMKSHLHVIIHLADMIRDAGQVVGWWCSPMKRFNGMMEGKSRTKVQRSIYLL